MGSLLKFPPVSNDGRVSCAQHGWSGEPLYQVWRGMLQRCYYRQHNRYHIYGGRGIEVTQEWWYYPAFRAWAQRAGYRQGLNIDRRDGDRPYAPDNCRWVPPQKSQRNRRNNRSVAAFGDVKTLADWADDPRCVVPYKVLYERLADGALAEDALTQPMRRKDGYRLVTAFGETKSITEWIHDPRCAVLSVSTLWARINLNWTPERALTVPLRMTGRG